MKLDNLASEGEKITAPMAVYHYSASVSRQFHGPEHYDGVITCPVISGPDDYDRAIELIAAKSNAQHTYQVQVNSLSFVGETPAPQPPEQPDGFTVATGQAEKEIACTDGMVVSVKSISFSALKKDAGGEYLMSGDIEWSDGVKRTHDVAMAVGPGSDGGMNAERLRWANTVCRARMLEFADTMCEPDNLPHR